MTAPAEYTEETADPSEITAPSETVEAPEVDAADTAVTAEEGGVLILGGTPIGNLADASDRLRSALATADLIAVEDTRKLRTLASGLGVRTRGRIIVNHDHNEAERSETIVLLLSDAGMPAISDPGYVAAAAVAEADLPVTVVPGPSAALTALALSGLPTGRFTFEGFLARKGSERTRRLASLAAEERTMIFYESPHRTAATLADFVQTFGADRRGTVSRELTKLHEEVRRGTLAELAEWAESERVRGEIVIIVEGAQAPETPEAQDVVQLVLDRVAGGERLKSACAAVAAETGTSKRDLYEAALAARSE